MKRFIPVVVCLIVLALMTAPVFAQKARAVSQPSRNLQVAATAMNQLRTVYTNEELSKGVYVGNNFCLACHKSMETYKDTNHASFLRRPLVANSLKPGRGVIADYDANGVDDFVQGLDFNTISSGFDAYKPNAPKLSVENGTYFITLGTMKMPVIFTLAGQRNGSAQRYGVKIPVTDTANKLSASSFLGPVQYDPKQGWLVYNATNWYDATTKAPKYAEGIGSAAIAAQAGNHTSGCVGCHATGIRAMGKTSAGEYAYDGYTAILFDNNDPTVFDYDGDGEYELMNIGCEDCHGPGSNHILYGGDPTKIVNPANLTKAQQSEICGRCHVTSKSVPAGTYGWPYNDATNTNWTPFDAKAGTPLKNFYTDTTKLWPDGKHQNGGRPYHDFAISGKANFQFHPIGCPDCHNPHNEGNGRLLRTEYEEGTLKIETEAENNTLCLACHATHAPFEALTKEEVHESATKAEALDKVAKTVEAHTHHPYAPERMMGLSRCTSCHMAISHGFDTVSPEETLKYQDKGGMPNSCAVACHNSRVDVFGFGTHADAAKWDDAFDVKMAKELKKYFGDGGIWWDTKSAQ